VKEVGVLIDGRYRTEKEVGEGAFKGWDERAKRGVRLRRVAGEGRSASVEEVLEWRGVAGTAAVVDVVGEGETAWVVTAESGRTLAEAVVQTGALSVEKTAWIGVELLQTLSRGHGIGLTHGSVRPENVLLPDWLSGTDRVVLTGGETAAGSVYGAPEGTEPARPAADLWSLGAVLYFAVEGVPPFEDAEAAVFGEPPRPPERAGDLGPLLLALLDPDPAARPTAAGGLAEALERLAHPEPVEKGVRVRPGPFAAAAACLVVCVAALTVITTVLRTASFGNTAEISAPTASPPRACELLDEERIERLIGPYTQRNPGSGDTYEPDAHCWYRGVRSERELEIVVLNFPPPPARTPKEPVSSSTH